MVSLTSTNSLGSKNPIRRIHSISGKLVIVLAPEVVSRFGSSMNEESLVEQLAVDGGILLRPISRRGDFTGVDQ